MKRFCFLLGFVFCFGALFSQSILFNYQDGSSSEYELSDVRKITFDNDVMNLHLNDGSVYNWNVSTISHYNYDQNTGIEQILDLVNFLDVNVYPNPINNHLNVSYNLSKSDNVSIEIYGYSGRLLIKEDVGNQGKGNHLNQLNTNELASGNYVLHIVGDKSSISKKIIKK